MSTKAKIAVMARMLTASCSDHASKDPLVAVAESTDFQADRIARTLGETIYSRAATEAFWLEHTFAIGRPESNN